MARRSVLVCGVLLLLGTVCKANKDYDNYTLIRLKPNSEEQALVANAINDTEIDVLKISRGQNDTIDLLVPPSRVNYTRSFADLNNLGFEVKQEHYGRSLSETGPPESPELDELPRAVRTARRSHRRSFNLYGYNSYKDILEFQDTVARRRPELVQVEDFGTSYQGRRMKLTKISKDPSAGNPIIFIDAGIHAREWVAPSMALYLIHRLTNDPGAVSNELDGIDWYILPVVNPDGYEFSRASKFNRMWRKTRSENAFSCYGVDGNRNYGFKWAVSGVSNNPCNGETYAGPKPFSEPETRIVRNIMMKNSQRMKLYVSMHSYGNYLVYPWGYTGDYLPKEWKKLDSLARSVSKAVESAGGQPFKVLSAGKWYPAAGGSDDFAFGVVGVPYSYTMELTDGYEFTYPENLLKSTLPQFYEGFKAFKENIKREYNP
ncbi:carboxypeptidase B-like [Plodia interpunctella]|uniref:carboxypeptidase B-like n=1 Tax=Plodia interpunctella TaxID=58824 RepID=UPI00236836EE|nr:carboxypeptidase B-like [Plodia interpunctella]